jgi:anthranilate synthase component II
MVFVLDNYDSFTYNLVQYLGELGAAITVRRNDQVTIAGITAMKPTHVVVSPGPGRPEDAGLTLEVIRHFGESIPVLGVCLGHQAIGAVFGGRVVRAPVPVHGKTAVIEHDGRGIFGGLTAPFVAGRYHSLVVAEEGLPADLEISARTRD